MLTILCTQLTEVDDVLFWPSVDPQEEGFLCHAAFSELSWYFN